MATLTASQCFLLRTTALSTPSHHPKPLLPLRPLRLRSSKPYPLPTLRVSASATPSPPPSLSSSTRTLSALSSLLLRAFHSASSKLSSLAPTPTPDELSKIHSLTDSLLVSVGPLFFAAIDHSRRSRRVSTPVSLVAGAITKWLDIYGGILMVRVLLSWFPNIPWDRQPLSAIRDLCDPYLNLFRNIIPPVFNTLDISPFFAFMLLGVFSTLLNAARFGVH